MPSADVPLFVYALLLHGLIGGLDVFLNHELLARLPAQAWSAAEARMHSARECLFFAIFMSLAWFAWHGAALWWIALLYLGEVLVGQALWGWSALPTAVVRTGYGWPSWVLTVMALGALIWAVRDGVSGMRRAKTT